MSIDINDHPYSIDVKCFFTRTATDLLVHERLSGHAWLHIAIRWWHNIYIYIYIYIAVNRLLEIFVWQNALYMHGNAYNRSFITRTRHNDDNTQAAYAEPNAIIVTERNRIHTHSRMSADWSCIAAQLSSRIYALQRRVVAFNNLWMSTTDQSIKRWPVDRRTLRLFACLLTYFTPVHRTEL